jgi:hypothetical protein
MPHLTTHAPGTFCWAELETTDLDAAKSFYHALFGWSHRDQPMGPGGVYTIFQMGGLDAAAAYPQQESERLRGVRSHWNLYISVADAEASTARAVELGAKLLAGPLDAGENGRLSILLDPTGATFYLWQGLKTAGLGVMNENNAFWWADLHTGDRAGAKRFYEALLGWSIAPGEGKDETTYLHIHAGGKFIGGILPDSHRVKKAPPHWMPYFKAAELDAAVKHAETLGASVFMPPVSVGGPLRIAMLRDPQLAAFALFEG